jgi:hypothetical protein
MKLRARSWLWLASVTAAAASCSVADNLTADEIVGEIDRIVRVEGASADRRIAYRDEAAVSAWYMRFWLLQPLRSPLGGLFGATRPSRIEQPLTHVRELATELRDELGRDLGTGATAAKVLGNLAEFERNLHSRIVGIDGLAALAERLGIAVFAEPLTEIGRVADAETLAPARLAVQVGKPDVRRGVDTPFAAGTYAAALTTLAAAPLPDAAARIALVEELAAYRAAETERKVTLPATEAALRRAIGHVIEGALLRAVQGRGAETVELRLCAMEQIRRLGGPKAVALLLAAMAATPAELASGMPRYDQDAAALVHLRLIHYAGQLSGPLALRSVTLPGREDEVPLAPAEFLATTILTETAFYSKVGTPASVALAWSLRRPKLDLDQGWVAAWRDGNRR